MAIPLSALVSFKETGYGTICIEAQGITFPFSAGELVELVEKRAMEAALWRSGGHKSNASKSLGMWRASFDRKCKKYGLDGYGKGQV